MDTYCDSGVEHENVTLSFLMAIYKGGLDVKLFLDQKRKFFRFWCLEICFFVLDGGYLYGLLV